MNLSKLLVGLLIFGAISTALSIFAFHAGALSGIHAMYYAIGQREIPVESVNIDWNKTIDRAYKRATTGDYEN